MSSHPGILSASGTPREGKVSQAGFRSRVAVHRCSIGRMDDRKWHILAAFLTLTGLAAKWLNLGQITYLGCVLIGAAIFLWTGFREMPDDTDNSE